MEDKSADEQTFEQYREALKHEATRLACFIRAYRLLQERRGGRPEELNIAPAFFQTAIDALFSARLFFGSTNYSPRIPTAACTIVHHTKTLV